MPKLRPNSQLYRTDPKEWLVGVRDTLNASDTINFSIPLSPARGIRPSIHLICLSVCLFLSVHTLPYQPPPRFVQPMQTSFSLASRTCAPPPLDASLLSPIAISRVFMVLYVCLIFISWIGVPRYPHSTLPSPSSLAIILALIHLDFFRLPHL